MAYNLTDLSIEYSNYYSMVMSIIGSSTDGLTTEQVDFLVYCAIDRAVKAILHYTDWAEIKFGYDPVVCSLAITYLNTDTQSARLFMGKPFISQQTQGSRSATYKADMPSIDGDGLTAEVKAALPLPALKVF